MGQKCDIFLRPSIGKAPPFLLGRRSDRGVDCSVRALFFFQAEIFHFSEQGTPVHTEAVRRRAAFPVVLLQSVQQVTFSKRESASASVRNLPGLRSGRLGGGLADDGIAQPRRPQAQVLVEHILQLADIAGPVIEHERVQHLAVHVLEALVAWVSLQEMLHQQGDVRLRSRSGGRWMGMTWMR